MKIKYHLFAVIFFSSAAVSAADESLSLSAGIGATYVKSGGNNAETTSWGPSAGIGYDLAEQLNIRGDLQHTQGRLLYDGLGGIARQSITAVAPGISWDILEYLNLDAEYAFRFGENNYTEHEGSLALMYSYFDFVRFGGDMSYSTRNYVFPVTERAIAASTTAFTLDVTGIPTDSIEIPVSASLVTSDFSTNKSAYSVYLGSAGLTLILAERRLRLGAAFTPGYDSSNYTLLGGEARASYKVSQHIGVRAFASFTTYSFTASTSAKGKRQSGAGVNPLGNSDSFDIVIVGLATTYSF
jgi:hypothetical protein